MAMDTRPLAKADYDQIVRVIDRWWGGPTSALAHPMFFYELGRLARVVESDGILVEDLKGGTPRRPATLADLKRFQLGTVKAFDHAAKQALFEIAPEDID